MDCEIGHHIVLNFSFLDYQKKTFLSFDIVLYLFNFLVLLRLYRKTLLLFEAVTRNTHSGLYIGGGIALHCQMMLKELAFKVRLPHIDVACVDINILNLC